MSINVVLVFTHYVGFRTSTQPTNWQENYWHKFFVEVVAYDFQNPATRVICKSLKPKELELQYIELNVLGI